MSIIIDKQKQNNIIVKDESTRTVIKNEHNAIVYVKQGPIGPAGYIGLDGPPGAKVIGAAFYDGYVIFTLDDSSTFSAPITTGSIAPIYDYDVTLATIHQLHTDVIYFNLAYTHSTHTPGAIHWNDNDKTLNIDTEVTDTSIQVGQENVVKVVNQTGQTITNGSVVFINGSQGMRPTVTLSQANTEATSYKTMGVATHDIPDDNGQGYVTTFGLVRDINTTGTPVSETWADGDTLFLSITYSGKMTNVPPSAPNHLVVIGHVVKAHLNEGVILVDVNNGFETYELHDVHHEIPTISGQYLQWDETNKYYQPVHTASLSVATITDIYGHLDGLDLTGFSNKTLSTISFDNTTRVFKIWPTCLSTGFHYYDDGTRYDVFATISVTLSNFIGFRLITFTHSQLIEYSTLQYPIPALICAIYRKGTGPNDYYIAEERHSYVMDKSTHWYLHNTRGAVINSNEFGIVACLSAPVGSTLSATINLNGGSIRDEDNVLTISQYTTGSDWYQQTLSPTAQLPVFYKTGSEVGPIWNWTNATDFPATTAGSGRLAYNNIVGGNWGLSEHNNNQYGAIWVFVTNIAMMPIISVLGQTTDNTIANARNNNSLSNLNLGGLPTSEIKLLYRIIYQTANGHNNLIKSDIIEIEDYRSTGSAPSGVIQTSDHNALAGRGTENSHPATAIYTDTSQFPSIININSNNVQLALNDISTHAHDDKYIQISTSTLSDILDTDKIIVNRGTIYYQMIGSTLKDVIRNNVFHASIGPPTNTELIWIDTSV